MKNHVWCLTLVLVCSLSPAGLVAQEKTATAPMDSAQAEMMKRWQAYMTPGEGHKKLAAFAGSWDATIRMWMDPTKPPTESKASEEAQWILGGRYLRSSMKSEMMGMPMEGQGIMGYDNFRKLYFLTWIDNFGTGVLTAEGTLDKTGTVITLYGKMDEPTTGEVGKTVKYVYRILGPDRHVFEIHDLAIGEPNTRVMEATYTRRK